MAVSAPSSRREEWDADAADGADARATANCYDKQNCSGVAPASQNCNDKQNCNDRQNCHHNLNRNDYWRLHCQVSVLTATAALGVRCIESLVAQPPKQL